MKSGPSNSQSVLRSTDRPQQASDRGLEIVRIGGMTVDALRSEWRRVLGGDPPPAFSKDLLARAIAYRLQEETYGDLRPATARLLRSLLRPGVEPPRQVKVGSVIVRDHKGVVHEVLVVPGGFCWQGKTYDSLSTIAKKITGVTWNGPRFFGLRSKKQVGREDGPDADGLASAAAVRPAADRPRPGRRSSLRSLSPASRARA